MTPAPARRALLPIVPGLKSLVEAIAQAHGVSIAELLGPSQRREHVAARRDLALGLRARGWSYQRIGHLLCRHHTTVIALLHGPGATARVPLPLPQVPVPDYSGEWAI